MTLLELIAEIGSEAIRIAWIYLEGQLTLEELENILGKRKAGLVHAFFDESVSGCAL